MMEVGNQRSLPSAVYRDEKGDLWTGQTAARLAVVYPDRAEPVPKRALMNRPVAVLGGHEIPAVDLVAVVLKQMYTEAVKSQSGLAPEKVVLTRPAEWEGLMVRRLREAAGQAGIADPEMVAEPVAAAWFYALPSADALVGIFDMGAGTLDTAVLRSTEESFEIAGRPRGNANLGGEYFDGLLLERVASLARDREPALWERNFTGDGGRQKQNLALLRDDVKKAKEALSELPAYPLFVPGYTEEFRITRPEFNDLIGPLVEVAAEEMRHTIMAAGVEPGELTRLYLIGGSSRIPLIAERLAEKLGVQVELAADPKAAVALGALKVIGAIAELPRARALLVGGDLDEAATAFRAILSRDTSIRAAHNGLAVALLKQRKLEEAKSACEKAVKIHPAMVSAYSNLAAALFWLGDMDNAEEACRKAISLNPDAAGAYATLGGVLLHMNKPSDAEAACRKALRIRPGMTAARSNRGIALRRLNRLSEAEDEFREVIRIAPDKAAAHRSLSRVLADRGKYTEAWAERERADRMEGR
jgi:molecular chaperone DnaK (HSP70)